MEETTRRLATMKGMAKALALSERGVGDQSEMVATIGRSIWVPPFSVAHADAIHDGHPGRTRRCPGSCCAGLPAAPAGREDLYNPRIAARSTSFARRPLIRKVIMPVRIIGMIGVTPPTQSATLLVIEGAISPAFVVDFAQAHEAAGFDMVLVGYTSSSADGFLVAMHAAARTDRLSYLIAHRPGFVAPTLFARKVATFDHLTGGRVALHVITGKTDAEQEGDGDFTAKAERYQRAQEYLHLMKRTWAAEAPFDFQGRFYRVRGAHSDVRPLQTPHPLIMFGGASEGALEMGAAECDVFAMMLSHARRPPSVLPNSVRALRGTAAWLASICRCGPSSPPRKVRPGTRRSISSAE